jgi:DNA polymerase-3 subunit chi
VTEIGFYHCTATKPDAALPRLLGRTMASGERALVLCRDSARAALIDAALWASNNPVWLPHGSEYSGDADLQPIWIAERPDAANGARFLFILDGAEAGDLACWARVFDLFDGADQDAVQAARNRWRDAKAAGHTLTYWRQGETGWAKQA